MTNKAQGYFPLFISLENKKVLIFGGGAIGARRAISLLEFGVDIKIIAPKCKPDLLELEKKDRIRIEKRKYKPGEIGDYFIVLGATDDKDVNLAIYNECKEKDILVNIASDKNKCDFFFPGIVKDKNLVIGITASGEDHKGVKETTKNIREYLQGR